MKFHTLLLLIGAAAASQVDASNLVSAVESSDASAPCVYLDETVGELEYQMEMFSRTLDPRHWTNVQNIHAALTKKGAKDLPKLAVKTWELYDKSWSFPRLRRYNFVMENMDMLEHFQDNLNTNISNQVNMENFLRVANTVRTNLRTKYHDGEFIDPADTDPKAVAAAAKAAASL
jgi:hypothetical protein